jgi:capsular exopolysaccharide synthesis family protein
LLSGLSQRVRRAAAPESASALNKRRITLLQPESFVAEQFRSLRARIDSLAATRPVRTLAVTSALPGDGKSLAAIGLAVVNSMQPGRRTLLVDCDLRQPALAASLGLRVDAGLAEVLAGEATIEEAVLRVEGSELDVLPVRTIPPNPSELLASEGMVRLLESLAGQYDRIILDLPPTLGLPDAKTISEVCDGVVFVVRADVTPEPEIASALEVIDRRRVLGLVRNGAEPTSSRYEGIR